MTSVDSASRAQPPRQAAPTPDARADPNDVRAMREAIDAARSKLEKFPPQQGKRPVLPGGTEAQTRTAEATTQGSEDPLTRRQQQREGTESLAGWNAQGGVIGTTTAHANPPAPQVDPSAFAQMLADLWTRENGRGSKEVRVRFGDRAWPATGARLVRNAAGGVDVALFVGDGGQTYGDKLAGLGDALTQAGVDLGSLAIEDGA